MERNKTLQKVLKKLTLFSSLDNKSLKIIEKEMKIVSYNNGEFLFKEGDSADQMYIIASGKIRVLKKGKGNSLIEITVLKSGSITDFMSLFERKRRSASLQAYGKVRV